MLYRSKLFYVMYILTYKMQLYKYQKQQQNTHKLIRKYPSRFAYKTQLTEQI